MVHVTPTIDSISCEYQSLAKFAAETAINLANECIVIVHVNIVSLDKHFNDLQLFLDRFSNKVEVLCISETRLTPRNMNYCNLPGYTLYHYNSDTHAGGFAICVSNDIKCRQLSQIKVKADECEDVWVELNLDNNETLIVGSVYRHPNNTNKKIKLFEDAFEHILKTFKSNQRYLVLSDYNIHFDKIDKSPTIDSYVNHINGIGCTQIINKPTRICSSCSSVIDYAYINSTSLSQVSSFILQEDISDHLPVCIKYQCKPNRNSKRPYYRKITQEGLEFFLELLNKKLTAPEWLYPNNYNLDKLFKLLNELISQHFPKKMQSRRQYKASKHPWITPDILTAIKHKKKLYSKYLKSKSPDLYHKLHKTTKGTTRLPEISHLQAGNYSDSNEKEKQRRSTSS